MTSRTVGIAGLVLAATFFAARGAQADEHCPAGSTEKKEGDLTWCEPSVCTADEQCPTGEVCRPVPLCVEVGTMPGKGGERLMARQRCGEGKACPQTTTCSEKSRCMTRAQADRAGLGAPASSAASAETGGGVASTKSSCGCSVPGLPPGTGGLGLASGLGLVAMAARRLRRRA